MRVVQRAGICDYMFTAGCLHDKLVEREYFYTFVNENYPHAGKMPLRAALERITKTVDEVFGIIEQRELTI